MQIENLIARSHPFGNRIDLSWNIVEGSAITGVRIVRRRDGYARTADEEDFIADITEEYVHSDTELHGEIVYYYSLFPFEGDPPVFGNGKTATVSAMAISSNNCAEQMYHLLPGIYKRYDTELGEEFSALSTTDRSRGQLRRFIDIPGGQLDLLFSYAKSFHRFLDMEALPGEILPLLAQWIGWKTDNRIGYCAQRKEIRRAPFLYETTGIIPTIEATIKRLIGWESAVKEFVHNISLTNTPERMNLWTKQRGLDDVWNDSSTPMSIETFFEGRPSAVKTDTDSCTLFYHALRNSTWKILEKKYDTTAGWSPNSLVTFGDTAIEKHPSAVIYDNDIWLFWDAWDPTTRHWSIRYRFSIDDDWGSVHQFINESVSSAGTKRRCPQVCTDSGGIWLFWQERVEYSGMWVTKYNRHTGPLWDSTARDAFIANAVQFPLDSGEQPRIETAPYVLFYPTDPARPLWIFWARKDAVTTGVLRWHVCYRVKQSLDPSNNDWGPVHVLQKDVHNDDYHDIEPTAIVREDGSIEVFWSSNKNDGWSIHTGSIDPVSHTWVSEPVTLSHDCYSEKTPLPVAFPEETLVVYSSNRRIEYASETYGAVLTHDNRYAGATTPDIRNIQKLSLQRKYEDFLTYTYDTGKKSDDWYAREAIGVFLRPDTENQRLIFSNRNVIAKTLNEFVPIQLRTVLILQSVITEYVYTYDDTTAEQPRTIGEEMVDTILGEAIGTPSDSSTTSVNFRWSRTWDSEHSDATLPDLSTPSPEFPYRLFLRGVSELEEGE